MSQTTLSKKIQEIKEQAAPCKTFTLKELWEANGRVPFKARLTWWAKDRWIHIVMRAPIGQQEFLSYDDRGYGIGYPGLEQSWVEYKT